MPEIPSIARLFVAIIEWVRPYYADYGYAIIFFSALMEHTILLGWLWPGGTLIMIGAFYAGQGVLSPFLVVGLALVGFMLGDLIDWAVGHYGGKHVLAWMARRGLIESADSDFLHRYLGKLLPLSYFGSVARAVAVVIAGASGYSYPRLLPFSLLGNGLFLLYLVGVGLIAGQSIEALLQFIESVGRVAEVLLLLAVLALLVFGIRRWVLFLKRTAPAREGP